MLVLLVVVGSDASRLSPGTAHAFHLSAAWQKDLGGYVASALVLATFAMQSMRPLRITAIASNVAFISYAAAADLRPILILHSVLLPLNLYRLTQTKGFKAN